jgi:hypothetical protein
MTSLSHGRNPMGLRSTGQGTPECESQFRAAAASNHAAVDGETAKVGGTTSPSDIGEAHVTPKGAVPVTGRFLGRAVSGFRTGDLVSRNARSGPSSDRHFSKEAQE